MALIQTGTIELAVEESGARDGTPLVLLRGLGTQLIQWPAPLLSGLASRGFRVITPDNRDVGLSGKLDALGRPDVPGTLKRIGAGERVDPPYTLAEMAADVVGLLDALEIGRAHVVGISMGGMIAQHLAITHGDRLRSLVSIMSSSGAAGLRPAKPEAMAALLSQPEDPDDRDSVIESSVMTNRVIGSPGYPTDDDTLRAMAGRVYDRCHHPDGVARQLLAVLSERGRAERLALVTAPTLVIHGEDDPLIPPDGGRDTAERIPGARLETIAGMGHDLPLALAPKLVDLIALHAQQADAA